MPTPPWVDVVEIGGVDMYLAAPDWLSGYCICAPPCQFDTATRVLGEPLDTRLAQNKPAQGVQILRVGSEDAPGIYIGLAGKQLSLSV